MKLCPKLSTHKIKMEEKYFLSEEDKVFDFELLSGYDTKKGSEPPRTCRITWGLNTFKEKLNAKDFDCEHFVCSWCIMSNQNSIEFRKYKKKQLLNFIKTLG
jgi:hypothetical protein